jgi:hypothetical protein
MVNSEKLDPRKSARKLRGQWTAAAAQSLNLEIHEKDIKIYFKGNDRLRRQSIWTTMKKSTLSNY